MMTQQQFREAIQAHGLTPPDVIEPGKFHRFPGDGKGHCNEAGWCKLFADGKGGVFGDYSTGLSADWQCEHEMPFSYAERAAFKRQIAEARQHAEVEAALSYAEAANKAAALLEATIAAPKDHVYLIHKGIAAHGARQHGDALVIPLRADGKLHSLQFIGADGSKRFLAGGRVAGCYFSIGNPKGAAALCIAEGFATGASIHEATGYPVAVAFNAGNLLAVAQAMRAKFADLPLIVCADDDYQTAGNPGVTKATETAQAVGGLLAVPDFGADRPGGATDFNDMAKHRGKDAVLDGIERATDPAKALPLVSADSGPGVDSARCSYGGGRFEVSQRGVFFIGTDKDGNELSPQWICSLLSVVAKTRDGASGEWGRLLEWRDDDGARHQWAMPAELLQGDGAEVRRELARLGLSIHPGRSARDLLTSYLQVWPVEARARCVDRLGWHGGVYVTPSESIGQVGEIVVFQNSQAIEPAFAAAGTADAWRDSVGRLAAGNSRLVFALSIAFAGALADVVGEDSGGFHLRGSSSSGKSTALAAAASVWGKPSAYSRLWRATANGLEGLAAMHNDGLLILDELSQTDPKEAGEAAYLLANGRGKARASRTGAARQSARWRLLFLSAGEESLTALMARAGKKANAGQEIRLADIEADAGAGMGAFEVLHDLSSPAELAETVKEAAATHYGAVGAEWLRRIVADRPRLAGMVADGMAQFVVEVSPADAAGQVMRVAKRFALAAVAGELATHYGLTGWAKDEATASAKKCFAVWLDAFGGSSNREERAILAQVRAFFEAHGASRFEDAAATSDQRIINRAGFYRTDANGAREFMVLTEAFRRDVCQGFDAKAVTTVLTKAGWLEGEGTRATQKPYIPALGNRTRCYVITSRMWEGE